MPYIPSFSELITIIEDERKKGKKVITTNGCFDILHLGHIRYLEKAAQHGDILVVGVNSDASVKKIKGESRPVNSQEDRAEVLAALKSVDYTFIFDEPDPVRFLSKIKPDVHVKGGDYSMEQIIERETVEANQGQVVLVPMVPGRSTSGIIEKISNE